jgi:hypothetical protein
VGFGVGVGVGVGGAVVGLGEVFGVPVGGLVAWLGVGVGETPADGAALGGDVDGGAVAGSKLPARVSVADGSAGRRRATSGRQSAMGRASVGPWNLSATAWTHASVLPGAGKWIRIQLPSVVLPVASTCWPSGT